MPQEGANIRTITLSSKLSFPSVNNYLTFSAFLFLSGFYYYYRVIQSIQSNIVPVTSVFSNSTAPISSMKSVSGILEKFMSTLLRHRLLFYILLNTCCALVTFTGKTLVGNLFQALTSLEERCSKRLFVVSCKQSSHILIWMPWLAVHAVCVLLLELSSSRMSNPLNIVSNKFMHRRLFIANFFTCVSSLVMSIFVLSIREHINLNYTLFMLSDCCLLLVQSVHLLFKLVTLADSNSQRQSSQTSSYYVDLIYDLVHDSIEFANYLHMIFFSQLAVTYCCVFLVVQARHYYTRISTKIQKHWQHQEIVRHISNCYGKANDEDLIKNGSCTICWQIMKSARKLPCGHVFHELCLRRWLEQDSSCAICRQPLALNLNHVLRNGEIIGEEMDNALQYVVEVFSPHNNRLARWWTRLLFESMNDDQVNAMVNHVAEMFPQVPRQVVLDTVRDTGSVTGAVDALLEGAGRTQNNDAGQVNNAAAANNEESGQNRRNTFSDEAESSDEVSVVSESLPSTNASDTESNVEEGERSNPNSENKTRQVPVEDNTLFGLQMKTMVEINKIKYLESSRADDIRHLFSESSSST
uniref:Uncharacterized protein n=1 Tax=Ditylenchus dipsaci TaxID=166011 RepID=A0A915E821_9BILA